MDCSNSERKIGIKTVNDVATMRFPVSEINKKTYLFCKKIPDISKLRFLECKELIIGARWLRNEDRSDKGN